MECNGREVVDMIKMWMDWRCMVLELLVLCIKTHSSRVWITIPPEIDSYCLFLS